MNPGEFWQQSPRSFAAVMRGRNKGQVEGIVLQAHQTEAMARQKTLKSPDHYLKPVKAKADGHAVAARLAAMEKAGMAVRVTRINHEADGS